MIVAVICGIAYATMLWLVATRVARSRALALGGWPITAIVLNGLATACIVRVFPIDVAAALSASLVGTVICAIVDARTGLIFDVLSIIIAVVAGVLVTLGGHLVDGLFAAIVVGGGLLALYLVTRARGIGLGDVKLGTALALGYGMQLSVVAIATAFIIGALYATALLIAGRAKRSDALRFGPFIAAGAAVGLTVNVLGYRW